MLEEARRGRQTGSGRDAYRGMEAEAGRQGRETGSQTEASKQASRMRQG
jgi:hypothetical protein